jgi:hypothetical protein
VHCCDRESFSVIGAPLDTIGVTPNFVDKFEVRQAWARFCDELERFFIAITVNKCEVLKQRKLLYCVRKSSSMEDAIAIREIKALEERRPAR